MIRHRLLRDPWIWASLGVLMGVCVLVIAAPRFMASGSETSDPGAMTQLLPPSLAHPFGTDHLGRDLYARVLAGGRYSLLIGPLVIGLSVLISVPLGALAGTLGGWFDELVMRITDIFLAFPQLLLAVALAAALGTGFDVLVLALVLTWWPWYARLMRAQALALRRCEYVIASEALGAGRLLVVWRHIIPNAMTPILVQATSDMGAAILAGAALSFLGLGVQPPAADWGQLVSDGRVYFPDRWWYATFPGGMIFVVAMAFGVLGDALHTALDPRLRS